MNSKIIWQTYKAIESLPPESRLYIPSWIKLNPDWKHHFCSDQDLTVFFSEIFPGLNSLFMSLPLPVMKADLWRYCVLYEYGGIYADIDTLCKKPIDSWLRNVDCLHVACEPGHPFFCQWAIYSPPKHPLLSIVISLIQSRVEEDGGVDESRPHYVHYYTGPGVWTDAIKLYLEEQDDPRQLYRKKRLFSDRLVQLHSPEYFHNGVIGHANASFHWRYPGSGYESWLEQRKDIGRLPPCDY